MKYLVLGSSGQIGGHLTKYLRSLGHEVFEWDIEQNQFMDLRQENGYLLTLMKKSDFIFFLAFDVGGSRYLKQYQQTPDFIGNNLGIMKNTFAAMALAEKPFIFASSQMATMGHSSYGALKSVGEFYAKALGGMVVKFWNVYGMEHDPAKAHVITDFIRMARQDRTINMLTDGSELRQFLYADDCCEALLILSEKAGSISDKELHITSFEWTTIFDVAMTVKHLIGPDVVIAPGSAADAVQKDARNEPSPFIWKYWTPKTKLIDGIRKIIEATV